MTIAGYFYWKPGYRNPTCERRPIKSDTPEPKPYFAKHPLTEEEMEWSLSALEAKYPLDLGDA